MNMLGYMEKGTEVTDEIKIDKILTLNREIILDYPVGPKVIFKILSIF